MQKKNGWVMAALGSIPMTAVTIYASGFTAQRDGHMQEVSTFAAGIAETCSSGCAPGMLGAWLAAFFLAGIGVLIIRGIKS